MAKASAITAAGRRRVEQALDRHGLLLVQGQWEIPSVADLLAGRPVTTRGYSWDYVPAWRHSAALAGRPDVATAKLFRGRSTLVHERVWPAVDTLADAAFRRVMTLPAGSELRTFLALVAAEPGIPGSQIRRRLGLDARQFQRTKGQLERRLCIFGTERDDLDHHTHESRWFPWARSKVALAATARRRDRDHAVAVLLACVYPEGCAGRRPRLATLFPLTG